MSKRSTTASAAVAASRARTGSKPVAITLRPGEVDLLDKLAEVHGGRKAAVMAGLRALERGGEPSPEAALKVLEQYVRGQGRKA